MLNSWSLFWALILGIVSIFAVWRGIPVLINAAREKKLLDRPDEDRKGHQNPTPVLGGVAIAFGTWLFFSLHPAAETLLGANYFLAASIVLFLVGLKDDLYVMSPSKKLLAQIAAAIFMVYGAGVSVVSFGGVFGIGTLPVMAGNLFSLFLIVVVINAMNLIDGVDGLSGLITVIASLFFAGWFALAGMPGEAVFAFVTACCFIGFLIHNWQPASIFMGDTGALISGLFLSVFGIRFLNSAINGPELVFWQDAAPVVLVALMVVPLYDTLRVFSLRVSNGHSPFHADAEHIHHHLIHMGLSHQTIALTLAAIQTGLTALVILLSPYLGVNVLLGIVVALSLFLFPTLSIKRRIIKKTPLSGIIENIEPYGFKPLGETLPATPVSRNKASNSKTNSESPPKLQPQSPTSTSEIDEDEEKEQEQKREEMKV